MGIWSEDYPVMIPVPLSHSIIHKLYPFQQLPRQFVHTDLDLLIISSSSLFNTSTSSSWEEKPSFQASFSTISSFPSFRLCSRSSPQFHLELLCTDSPGGLLEVLLIFKNKFQVFDEVEKKLLHLINDKLPEPHY